MGFVQNELKERNCWRGEEREFERQLRRQRIGDALYAGFIGMIAGILVMALFG